MKSKLKDIVENKAAKRKQLAAKPVAEKLAIVEQLAERALATRPDSSRSLPDEPWEIPKTWRWDKMGNVAKVIGGGTPSTTVPEYWGGDIRWITPADLAKHRTKNIARGSRSISRAGLEHSGAQMLPIGAVLFSSRAPIGYVAIADNPVATNQGFKSFVLSKELESDFVYYYLLRARELAVALASGTTFLEISGKNAARLPIPIPPRPEQRRIVAEIEKHFARIDVGLDASFRTTGNLRRFHSAIVASALSFSQKHIDYAWSSLEDAAAAIVDCPHSTPPFTSEGMPCIDTTCITPGRINLERIRFVSRTTFENRIARLKPLPGDIVFAREGTVGTAIVIPDDFEPCLGQRVMLIRTGPSVDPRYLMHVLNSPIVRRQYLPKILGTTAPHLNVRDVKKLLVPLPARADQERIAAEIEHRLSVIDEVTHAVETNLRRAKTLRQSVLQRAFSGQL